MLDYEPASDHEESGEENSGGQERELTAAAVDDLLNIEEELDSMTDFGPRNQSPLKAKGTTKASPLPAPEEAAQVAALSALQAELEKVKAELARKEKHQAEELAEVKAAMMKMNEEKKQADAKIKDLEDAEASRTSRPVSYTHLTLPTKRIV